MTPEQISFYQEIARELRDAKHGEKTKIVNRVLKHTGLSRSVLYKELEKVGYETNRKTRSDKGTTSIDIDDVKKICFNMDGSNRNNDKRLRSCDDAIDLLYSNGEIKERYVASTILRLARQHGCHPDQLMTPTPYQDLKSNHPNHVWQFDASICILFYMPNGGIQSMDADEYYKNKPKNLERIRNDRAIRYVMTDHTTGMLFVKYYVGSGETQEIIFDFLVSSFERKDRHPMHGVPLILIMDKGSANISHAIRSFLTRMQINHFPHSTGNSRAKGSVEVSQNIVETGFESLTRDHKYPVKDVDDLNRYAMSWQLHFNSTKKHSRHGMTRTDAWLRITEEQLRIAPFRETMETLLTGKLAERTVTGNLRIQYKFKAHDESFFYSLKHIKSINVGDKVQVTENPFNFPNLFVITYDLDGKEVYNECSPSDKTEWGFYEDGAEIGAEMKSMPDTPHVQMQKEAFAAQYPEAKNQEEAKKLRKKNVPMYGGKIDAFKHINEELRAQENVTTMPKRGVTLEVDAPKQVLENVPVPEICTRLKADLGEAYPKDAYSILKKKYPDGVDPMLYDEIKQSFETKSKLRIING